MIDSVYRKDENYYRTVFLEKYTFNDVIEIYFDDSDEENSDDKIEMKKVECIILFLEKKVTASAVILKHEKNFFVFQALQVPS